MLHCTITLIITMVFAMSRFFVRRTIFLGNTNQWLIGDCSKPAKTLCGKAKSGLADYSRAGCAAIPLAPRNSKGLPFMAGAVGAPLFFG
jgi:hypothetical protein